MLTGIFAQVAAVVADQSAVVSADSKAAESSHDYPGVQLNPK